MTRWVQPTDEELFQKYNPELQKRSLERRFERQQEFDDFVNRLKRDSKSDKPSKCLNVRGSTPCFSTNQDVVWTVQAEAEKERVRQASIAESLKAAEELKARKEAMRREVGLPAESASSETTR